MPGTEYHNSFWEYRPCRHCGADIHKRTSAFNRGEGKFCSQACSNRFNKNGPIITPPLSRFWEKVDRSGECWLWTGSKNQDGYGTFMLDSSTRRNVGAHRASYLLNVGPIDGDLQVCHRCDNPPCVRPDHLFLGTRKENTRDSLNKGRLCAWRSKRNHCKFGHEFTTENTVNMGGHRRCRICYNLYQRKLRARKKASLQKS